MHRFTDNFFAGYEGKREPKKQTMQDKLAEKGENIPNIDPDMHPAYINWSEVELKTGVDASKAREAFYKLSADMGDPNRFAKSVAKELKAMGYSGKGFGWKGKAGVGLSALFALPLIYEIGKDLYGGYTSSAKRQEVLESLKAGYPEEQKHLVEEAFNSLSTVAPNISEDPLLSRSVMKSMMQMMTHAQHADDVGPVTDLGALATAASLQEKRVRGAPRHSGLSEALGNKVKNIDTIETFVKDRIPREG